MASFGKLVASALHATNENTLALANMNFDFSLMKVDAPPEYTRLGHILSKRRRNEAEDGITHSTARKLSALLQDDIPEIPLLLNAYGKRSTEIATSSEVNPKDTSFHGPFTDHVGADGTSLWAAATSGKGAIEVHLLACMLAKVWSPGEAVSIWIDVVRHRKHLFQETIRSSSTFPAAASQACRIDISREQLVQWDSSAR